MTDNPVLSIIITSYSLDRLKDSCEVLESIKAQTCPDTETIFVVEKSPGLLRKIENYVAENDIPRTHVIFNDGVEGMSAARNLGIENTRGRIIAFVDDDSILPLRWAEEMVRTYEDGSIIGVSGIIKPLWEDDDMDWFPEELDWLLGCSRFSGISEMVEIRNVWGANMSFRKEAFEAAGVFSSGIGAIQGKRLHGEELELSLRVKKKTKKRIVCNPAVWAYHKVYRRRFGPRWIAQSSYWIGYTRHLMKSLYPDREGSGEILRVEFQLLKRIFTRLLPAILKGLFTRPGIACRQFYGTTTALTFVAFGYCSHFFSGIGNGKQSY
jgi:glycosyltransferase involved in cell wall biosynthesis